VKFSGEGFEEEAADDQYGGALCGQFKAYGCAKTLDCCPDDQATFNYAEHYMYYDKFPDPRLPTPGCLQGPTDELCSSCEGAVTVKLEEGMCDMYPDEESMGAAESGRSRPCLGKYSHDEGCTKEEEGSFLSEREAVSNTLSPVILETSSLSFGKPKSTPTKYPDFPGPPAHKPVRERVR